MQSEIIIGEVVFIGKGNKRRVEQRQEEASARQELRWKRTSRQQLNRLDDLLGKNIGAAKERVRLLHAILDETAQKIKTKTEKIETLKTFQDAMKTNEKTSKRRLSPKELKILKKQEKKKLINQ